MNLIQLLKATGKSWVDDHAMRLSAALAYYAVFSLAPLLIVAISIAGAIFGEDAARGAIRDHLTGWIGNQSAEAVQEMIKGARNSGKNGLMAVVGFGVLLITASGVFAQLKDAMNTVWGLETKPGRAIFSIMTDYFLSLTMVVAIGFLLLVSLVLSAVVAAATGWLVHVIPIAPVIWHLASIGIDLTVITLLFAMIFKVLPDADIQWRDVWTGAFITACLFAVGKILLALYLGRSETASTYGAAGALLLILSWVYYSSNILLFGAEFTQEFARSRGRTITPSAAAIRMPGSDKETSRHVCNPIMRSAWRDAVDSTHPHQPAPGMPAAGTRGIPSTPMTATNYEPIFRKLPVSASPSPAIKGVSLGKAEELKSAAGKKVEEVRNKLGVTARELQARCERETRDRPARALPIAFGAGLLIGFLCRRL